MFSQFLVNVIDTKLHIYLKRLENNIIKPIKKFKLHEYIQKKK